MERMESKRGFAYYGDREGWLIAAIQAPDYGDAIQRSNFRSMLRELGGASDDVAVEYTGGALGSIDYLLVRPDSPAVETAERIRARIDDYILVDEDDLSALEWDEEWCVRCDRGTREQHPLNACHKFRSKDDAREIAWRWNERGHARRWQSQ